MTLQGLRKSVTSGILTTGMAVALMFGVGMPTAHADLFDDLAAEFGNAAAGAGQVANLLNTSMKLRAMGFKPNKANYDAVQDALKYRPNQTPLIHALQQTVEQQNRQKEQAEALAGNNQFTIGINQYDPNSPGGVTAGAGGINIGGGAWTIGDGRSGELLGPAPGG
jgi:hypothetical protein